MFFVEHITNTYAPFEYDWDFKHGFMDSFIDNYDI